MTGGEAAHEGADAARGADSDARIGILRTGPLALELATSEASEELGRRLGAALAAGEVLVLTGPLGAGKTTLTRGLGEGLGVRGAVASPTFVIARTHPPLAGGPALIHVDAYRLRDPLELEDLDLDLERSVAVIEWGAPHVAAIAGSWLELVLERPHALAAGEDAALDEDAPRRLELRSAGPDWTAERAIALLDAIAPAVR